METASEKSGSPIPKMLALNGNMGAGEMAFLSVTHYLHFFDLSVRTNTRLSLQIFFQNDPRPKTYLYVHFRVVKCGNLFPGETFL